MTLVTVDALYSSATDAGRGSNFISPFVCMSM